MRKLWEPTPDTAASSRLGQFLTRNSLAGYDQAWAWSVSPSTSAAFWRAVAADAGLDLSLLGALDPQWTSTVEHARWFPDARLNYAAACLRPPSGFDGAPAVLARSDTRGATELTWFDLRALVGRVAAGLVAAGVQPGDHVAGYLPNIPEALAGMLAAASLGAVWTCCAPEMGVAGCLDRLTQCDPVVLIAVDGYRYGSKVIDRNDEASALGDALPGLRQRVWVSYLDPDRSRPAGWTSWDAFTSGGCTSPPSALSFTPVAFDHPLYVLYSSGTTGKPKAIVHGHGGILLEHVKALGLHFDIRAGDRFFWYSTTGWMMWNFCVSGLAVGATVVLFDGEPGADRLWSIMDETQATHAGVGASYLAAGMKAGHAPGESYDLSRLRVLGSTGSPLSAAAASWVYSSCRDQVMLASFSGGTDVCTGFVGTSPLHPVWAGEMSCRCLGCAVDVFDDGGRPVVGQEGELVVTAPMPSMPVGFVGDPDGRRYHETYFERFPGVWAHGDRAMLTDRGTVMISGRSDGTLNRGGVRMGTGELYAIVEALPGVADSLAVHLEDGDQLLLFVVPSPGADFESLAALADNIRAALRSQLSPRHVPDVIEAVPAIPRTLSGKKLEVPVKQILAGASPAAAVSLPAVADPASLQPFVELGRRRGRSSGASG